MVDDKAIFSNKILVVLTKVINMYMFSLPLSYDTFCFDIFLNVAYIGRTSDVWFILTNLSGILGII